MLAKTRVSMGNVHMSPKGRGDGSPPALFPAPARGSDVREDPQLVRTGGMAHALERLGLDLANPLAGHAKLLPDLLERPVVAVGQPVPETQHARLPRLERFQERHRAGAPLG